MKAIVTKYRGPSNVRGSRIIASDQDGNRVIVPYDHSSRDPHQIAAAMLCRKMGWTGTLQEGDTKDGKVFVWLDTNDQIEVR